MSYCYECYFSGWPVEVPQLDDTCDHKNSYFFFQLFSVFVIEAEQYLRRLKAKKEKDTKKDRLSSLKVRNIYGHMKMARPIVDLTWIRSYYFPAKEKTGQK